MDAMEISAPSDPLNEMVATTTDDDRGSTSLGRSCAALSLLVRKCDSNTLVSRISGERTIRSYSTNESHRVCIYEVFRHFSGLGLRCSRVWD